MTIEKGATKWKDHAQLFLTGCAVISVLWGAFTYISTKTGAIITIVELDQHDSNEKAHPSITRNVVTCEDKVEALSKRVEESHDVEVALGARFVRLAASDQEPSKLLKAAAANYYEQEYRLLIKKGTSVEDAIIEALRSPFYLRPRQ